MTFRFSTLRRAANSIVTSLLGLLAFSVNAADARDFRPSRLADGHPNLQGNWDYVDLMPLERLPEFNSLVIDKQQAARLETALNAQLEDRQTPTEPTEYFIQRRLLPIRGELHSSIIVEPQNGKLPWKATFANWSANARRGVLNAMDGPEQRPNSERCLGNPASQPPHIGNPGTNLHQIVQTKDVVVFVSEWMHEARIIRLNSAHAPAAVTSWLGDSIGWWDGDTLVVETKNFTPSDTGRIAMPNVFMISAHATVTERFRLDSHDELHYEFTVDDPECYAQAWRGETHFTRTADQILEYSCHEDNRSMVHILQGARVRDGQLPTGK